MGELPAWVFPLAVALVTALVFTPALQNGFVSWDDDRNFTDNPAWRGLGWTQLRWMWTTFHMGHWIPLTWMTLGLDYELWGMHPAGYHLVNVALHVVNAVLLYRLAVLLLPRFGVLTSDREIRMTAALGALLFAVHPLRVESVVWVTERRDMLSLLFMLLSVTWYVRAVDGKSGSGALGTTAYLAAVGAFALALLSKGTAVTLPAVLLVLNVFPLRRLVGGGVSWVVGGRRVAMELLPFVALSAAFSVLSVVALKPPDQLPLGGKVAVTAYSLAFYLWKTLVPVNLAPIYEMPKVVNPADAVYVACYAMAIVLAGVLVFIRRRSPGTLTAAALFFVIVFPLLGPVQNGPQIAADRYTYHASPPLMILAAAGLVRLGPTVSVIVGSALVVILGGLTSVQTGVWRDSTTLWSHVVRLRPESSIGQVALGRELFDAGRVDEAIEHYRRGVALDPGYAEGYNNLGVALARQGNADEALRNYERALQLKPAYPEAFNNMGIALGMRGDLAGAERQFERALALRPDYVDARINWGNALVRGGRPADAIPHYQAAIAVNPNAAEAHFNWGVALAQQRQLGEAIEHFIKTLEIAPHHAEAARYLEQARRLVNGVP